jgi:hypothetical protein
MNILVYSSSTEGNAVTIECSDGRMIVSPDWVSLTGFLLMPCDHAFVWSVDKLFDDISTTITKKQAEKLTDNKTGVIFENRKVYYQTGRILGLNQINLYSLKYYADSEPTCMNGLLKLACDTIDAYKQFGIEPTDLSSPVKAYSQVLDVVDFPRACDLPESSFGMLNTCAEKEWVEWRELYKVGHWNKYEVLDFDIHGAYPSLIARLPDIRNAKYFESDTMPDDYSWGDMVGKLTVTKDVTPFGFMGTKEAQITTDELWLIKKYELGTFELKHGWFFKLPKYYNLPFKDIMQTLYEKRQNENPVVKKIAQAISVGIGGKFAQRSDDGRLGEFYNGIYARLITSRCSVKVADFIWRNGLQDNVVSVLVDGVLVESAGLSMNNFDGKDIGSWRVNESSAFLVASLLYQWSDTKKPNKLYYNDMIKLINEKPNSSIYGDIDLNILQHDRLFDTLPRTGKDLLTKKYSSKPIIR